MDIRTYLAEQGLTKEEIDALVGNEKAAKAMTSALAKFEEGTAAAAEATTKLEAANAATTEAEKFWNDKVTPALAGVDKKVATATSETARYKAYLQSLKDQGYDVPDELLSASGAPGGGGAGAGAKESSTSTNYLTREDLNKELSGTGPTLISLMDLSNQYADLYGGPYLTAEADFVESQRARKPFRDFVRDKYKFETKRQEKSAAAEQTRINSIVDEKVKAKEAELAAKYGSNGELRAPLASKFDKIEKIAERKDSWKTQKGREESRKNRLNRFENIQLQ